ncbi:MAG: AI-2E family transporter [Armatimonadetes bacterium]|nr:AI-2E family transporter [Armatimonadota bacterium]
MAWRVIGWAAVVAATIYFIYVIRAALTPFIIGGAIALLLNPTVEALQRRHNLPRSRAVLNIFLAFIFLTLAIGIGVGPFFYSQAQSIVKAFSSDNGAEPNTIERFSKQFEEQARSILVANQGLLDRSSTWLSQFDLPSDANQLADEVKSRVVAPVSEQAAKQAGALFKKVVNAILGAASTLLWLILIPIIVYFLMLEMDSLHGAFLFLIPPPQRPAVKALLDQIGGVFLRYVRGLMTLAVFYGIVSSFVYFFAGVPSPLLVGVLAGLLYPVPYIGALSTALISGGLTIAFGAAHPAYFVYDAPPMIHALVVILSGVSMNVFFDMIITPRVLGNAVGLRPLASLFAILVGAQVFGIWGMLLAVPVATTAKIIVEKLLYYFYGQADFLGDATSEPCETDGETVAEPATEVGVSLTSPKET